jgi:hypothetical protein
MVRRRWFVGGPAGGARDRIPWRVVALEMSSLLMVASDRRRVRRRRAEGRTPIHALRGG